MYSDKNLIHIFTILEAIEKIFLYTSQFEDDEAFYYAQDQLYFNAVVNLLIAVGEETKKIDEQIKGDFTFKWNEIAKMRDKISHNYRGISPYVVWDIVIHALQGYKELLRRIAPQVNEFEEALRDALASDFYKHLVYLQNYK